MTVGVFVQARLASARFPRKALALLRGTPIIEHVLRACRRIEADVHALLTDGDSEESLGPVAGACGFALFVGDPDDVLSRYIAAAERFNVATAVRATGDNPLVSARMADRIVRMHLDASADYSRFDGLPLGTGVEVVRTGALKIADSTTDDPYDREHVTPYLYRHPEAFRLNIVPVEREYRAPDSVTIDTPEDLKRIERILRKRHDVPEIDGLVAALGIASRR